MRMTHWVALLVAFAFAMSWRHGARAGRSLSAHGEAHRTRHGWVPKNAGPEFFTADGWRERQRMHAWAWGGLALALGLLALGAIFR